MTIAELSETFAEPSDRPDEHVPPQDLGAERSVLGSMLLDRHALEDCLEELDGPDFYRPAHEAIWDAACPPDRFVTPWPEVQQP